MTTITIDLAQLSAAQARQAASLAAAANNSDAAPEMVSVRQAAKITGISVGAVRTYCTRAQYYAERYDVTLRCSKSNYPRGEWRVVAADVLALRQAVGYGLEKS
jgi:hypothetical protein